MAGARCCPGTTDGKRVDWLWLHLGLPEASYPQMRFAELATRLGENQFLELVGLGKEKKSAARTQQLEGGSLILSSTLGLTRCLRHGIGSRQSHSANGLCSAQS